jgi:hypothetical protein
MDANETTSVLARLQAAGLKVKVPGHADGSARYTTEAASNGHPRRESIEIDVDVTGKVVRASKYSYLLPESVGDDIRLA